MEIFYGLEREIWSRLAEDERVDRLDALGQFRRDAYWYGGSILNLAFGRNLSQKLAPHMYAFGSGLPAFQRLWYAQRIEPSFAKTLHAMYASLLFVV